MSKSIKGKLVLLVKRVLLKRRGVVMHNNTVFSNIEFLGTAVVEPYCRLSGDPKLSIGNNFYCNA